MYLVHDLGADPDLGGGHKRRLHLSDRHLVGDSRLDTEKA
jgi:hypothetical protein